GLSRRNRGVRTVRTPPGTATVMTFFSAAAVVIANVERETVNESGVTSDDTTDSPSPQAALTRTWSREVGLTENATPEASAMTRRCTSTGSRFSSGPSMWRSRKDVVRYDIGDESTSTHA